MHAARWGFVEVAGSVGREAASNEALFSAAYRAHKADVYRWALRLGGGRRAFAEDVAHEVFVRLLLHLEQLDAPGALGGWLYRVTVNLACDQLRREQSWLSRWSRRLQGAPEPVEAPLDERLAERQLARRALELTQRLPARERVILWMALVDDKSQKEIAEILGLSPGYVSKLYERARAKVESAGWEIRDAGA